jgi:LuxR family maltose regulon positive regulatory protein
LEAITYARYLLAGDRVPEVLDLLERGRERAESGGRWGEVIRLLLLRAGVLSQRGDTGRARAALTWALGLAEPGGYLRSFVDADPPLNELLYQPAAEGIHAAYVGRILAALPEEVSGANKSAPASGTEDLVEPLSEREVEVLTLIAKGLTNRETGRRLNIVLGTVKTHTYNIYSKLAVNSRTAAVTRAQSLGILEAPGA